MLRAIDLDDQSRLEAHEVDDVPTERMLTSELVALELLVAK